MIGEDLLYAGITELSTRIRARRLSPVELAEAYLERIQRFSPVLNAFETVAGDVALMQARLAESDLGMGRWRGPLHGIPWGAKDLLATAGLRTTWGAVPLKEQVFDFDATVVTRLREAGAVLLGQVRDGRTRGRAGLSLRRRLGERPRPQPVGPGALDRRFVLGLGRGGRGRTRDLRARHRDLGLHPLPRGVLRAHGPAADLRARQPRRRDGRARGPSTRWARSRARRPTAGTCSAPSPGPTPTTRRRRTSRWTSSRGGSISRG